MSKNKKKKSKLGIAAIILILVAGLLFGGWKLGFFSDSGGGLGIVNSSGNDSKEPEQKDLLIYATQDTIQLNGKETDITELENELKMFKKGTITFKSNHDVIKETYEQIKDLLNKYNLEFEEVRLD